MNDRLGGPLLGLSFCHVSSGLFVTRDVPRVPTNAERMRAYRPYIPTQFANADAPARHRRIDTNKPPQAA